MPERKPLTVTVLIVILIAQRLLPLVQFGPTLEDPEFDAAKERLNAKQFPDSAAIQKYPFMTIDRLQGARQFVHFAKIHTLHFVKDASDCNFADLKTLNPKDQKTVIESCRYGFFKGFMGEFVPNDPLTKASTTVVAARILSPEKQFPDVKEFRTPYLEEAVRIGILKNPEHPYLMYPISRYELVLMMRRMEQAFASK